MSERPRDEITCSDIINGKLYVRLHNLIIEQCILECERLVVGDRGSRLYAVQECVTAIRKLKKQEDSSE